MKDPVKDCLHNHHRYCLSHIDKMANDAIKTIVYTRIWGIKRLLTTHEMRVVLFTALSGGLIAKDSPRIAIVTRENRTVIVMNTSE